MSSVNRYMTDQDYVVGVLSSCAVNCGNPQLLQIVRHYLMCIYTGLLEQRIFLSSDIFY